MAAVKVDGRGNSFAAQKEQVFFKFPDGFGWYDVGPDGKRFVMIAQKVSNVNATLTLVQNWTALQGSSELILGGSG